MCNVPADGIHNLKWDCGFAEVPYAGFAWLGTAKET